MGLLVWRRNPWKSLKTSRTPRRVQGTLAAAARAPGGAFKRWEKDGGKLPAGGCRGRAVRGRQRLPFHHRPSRHRAGQLEALRRNREFVLQSVVFQMDGSPTRGSRRRSPRTWARRRCCASPATRPTWAAPGDRRPRDPGLPRIAWPTCRCGRVRAAGAPAHAFRHNDPAISSVAARHGPGLVVDSVYSTTGALCPLAEMVDARSSTAA